MTEIDQARRGEQPGDPGGSSAVDQAGPPAVASNDGGWRTAVAVLIVGAAFALPLRALFRYQGPPMEEGFMLVFPERVLRGALPNRDFLHLYGPGSLWALAGWFKAFGISLASERMFGMVQLLGVVFGVFVLALPWGRKAATAAGLIGVLITLTAIGLTALAWDGAVALGLIGLIVGLRARRRITTQSEEGDDRRVATLLVASGLLAGLALLFRPDLILGVGLGFGGVLWGLGRRRWQRFLLGLAVGVSPYLIQFATAGPGHSIQGMLFDPVFKLRGGRTLPAPPSWNHFDGALQSVAQLRVPHWPLPALATTHQIVIWFYLIPVLTLATVVVGVWRVRAEPTVWRPRVMLAVGLFGLGLLPQGLQRPDTTHFSWVSCVPLAFLPAVVAEVLSHMPSRQVRRRAGLVSAAAGLVLLLVAIPHFTYRTYADLTGQTFGRDIFGYGVKRGSRVFYLGSEPDAQAARRLVADIGARSRQGQKLFVGTADLRKTPYSDAYFYYLLPELTPSTYYIEMDPGVANAKNSGLERQVADSDWLILSHIWDSWREKNDSRKFGPDGPNQVVRRQFCLVNDYDGVYALYQRCRPAT
jgi:hypothetical protein